MLHLPNLLPEIHCQTIQVDLEASFLSRDHFVESRVSVIFPDFTRVLQSISASSSEVSLILDFLQRRKFDANKAKNLCLAVVRAIILYRRPISTVTRAIDVLLTIYSHAIKTGSYYKRTKVEETPSSRVSNISNSNASISEHKNGVNTSEKSFQQERVENESYNRSNLSTSDSDCSGKTKSYSLDSSSGKMVKRHKGDTSSSQLDPPSGQSQDIGPDHDKLISSTSERQESTSAAISPMDMRSFVFSPVEDEMRGDGSYLVAIIMEFLRRCILTPVLMVQILARDECYAELGLFVMNKIIEPSKEVAMQLLECGRQNHHIRKLGLNMLRQLLLHHDYVLLLVQDGFYLEALRYARKFKVNTVGPSLFLEATYASKDLHIIAAVLRFFSDFIPGFKTTSDHNTYYRLIAEMSS